MAKGNILQAIVDVAGSIDPSLGKTMDSVAQHLEGINFKALAVAGAIGGIAVATFNMAMDAGEYLLDLGTQFDSAADSIRIGTGAVGDDLDDLLADFDAVYASVPTNMEDASQAIADFNTRLGLTGPTLQDISKQAIQVSDMLGDDLGGVIEESSQAFQQWNIDAEDMGDAMDYVFKVSQDTGLGFTDLMSKAQQFGPQLQELGYSFEEATALMGQLDKAGVNTDEVLAAMKKSVGSLANEGIGAAEGLAMYVERIQEAETAAEAAAIANEVFGARAGSGMAAAIRDGTLAVDDLTSSLLENQETIAGAADDTYDFAERLQMMKQGLEVALKPMANTIFDGLNDFMPVLQDLMESTVPIIGEAVEAAMPFVEEFLMGMAEALQDVAPLLVDLAGGLLPVLTQLVSSLLPPLLKLAKSLLPPLMQIVDAILPPVAEILTSILPMLSELGAALLPVLAEMIAAILPVLTPLLQMAISMLNDAIIPILPLFAQMIDAVLPVIIGLIESMLPVLTPLLDLALQILTDVVMPLMPLIMQLVEALLPPILSLLNAILPVLGPLFSALTPIADILATIVGWIAKVVGWVADGLAWVVDLFTGGANVEVSGESPSGYASGGFTEGLSIAGEDPDYPIEAIISFNPAFIKENLGYWARAGELLGVGNVVQTLYDNGEIPAFEQGGFTNGLSIAGEDQDYPVEAVISFNPAYRDQNLSYWAQAGQMLGAMEGYDTGGSVLVAGGDTTTVVYDLGGVTFAPNVTVLGDADKQSIVNQLHQEREDFFDFLEEFLKQREVGKYAEGNRLF